MRDELMRAQALADAVTEHGVTFTARHIGKLARRGKLPIAARDRSGRLLFSDRAIAPLLERARARTTDGE